MDSVETSTVPYQLIITIVIIAIIVGLLMHFMVIAPKYKRADEGFFGGVARGVGHPDCLRTLPEASEILDTLSTAKTSSLSEGSADYQEFQLILSKMACLKKDLMSPSGIVEATRYQTFETAHDRMSVAEVCSMCMNQTIAPRDLDIVFATWRDRGKVLLRKLCTEANLQEQQVVRIETLFKKMWEDVYEISKGKCLKTDFSKQNGGAVGREVGAFEPENLKDHRSYNHKYGGLSASGWNGAN